MDQGAQAYARYLAGDDGGLAEIIRDYSAGLTAFLCTVTGDWHAAEEVMEDVFFRLAAKKPKFRGKSSFKTRLYAIGRNAAGYLAAETKRALYACIGRLPPDYRQALTLSYFEGLDNGQTAAVMKKSRRQIENLLYRAKAALKKELEKEGIGHEDL